MPRILTTCPTSGRMVPTGHRTSGVTLETMDAPRSFRCPTCQQVHSWNADEAVVETTITLATLRSAA